MNRESVGPTVRPRADTLVIGKSPPEQQEEERREYGPEETHMVRATDIRTATERSMEAMRKRPKRAQSTARTIVTLRPGGTSCEIEDGPWRMLADLGRDAGFDGAAPDPGVFGRGALGACMVLAYELWAARLGVCLSDVRVIIESDFNALGMYGLDDAVSPGWQAVRCTIEVTSSDDPARVAEVIDLANRRSPLIADISMPVPVTWVVHISPPVKE